MKRLNRFALNLGITLILSAASVSATNGPYGKNFAALRFQRTAASLTLAIPGRSRLLKDSPTPSFSL